MSDGATKGSRATGDRFYLWGADPLRIVIVCPFYFCDNPERAEITRRIFRHYSAMPVPFVGCGSEGRLSSALFGESFGAADKYVEHPQDFDCFAERVPGAGCAGLRHKFDVAVQAAREWDADYVFCTGSDDLVPWEFYRDTPASGATLLGVGGGSNLWHIGAGTYERLTSSGFEGAQLVGGPLGFSRAYLDACGWEPFSEPNCEVGAERKVRREGGTVEAWPGSFWQVKSAKCLNPIQLFRHRSKLHAPDEEFEAFQAMWARLASQDPTAWPAWR